MDLGLEGRIAIVTGGSQGIGRAIADVLVEEGAVVAICARRREPLEAAAAEINAAGGRAFPVVADVGRHRQRRRHGRAGGRRVRASSTCW